MKSISLLLTLTVTLTAMVAVPARGAAREPLLSVVGGGARETPFHAPNFHGDYGWRAGLGFNTTLPAGELRLPLELDLILRRAELKSTDTYDENIFTDLQLPVIFHGPFSRWRRLEIMALFIPSYTVDMRATSSSLPDGGSVVYTDALRTRFNMGFGGGVQVDAWLGIRLRSFWVHNIFSAFPASNLTFSDVAVELAVPFLWKGTRP